MKKILGVVAGLWAGVAFAGDYHVEHTLRCSECHTMHASRSHGLNQQAFEDTFKDIGINATGNRNLLLWDGTNATCLACHDGQPTFPDILGTDGGMTAGTNVRSAGALNSSGLNGLPAAEGGYDHFDGHTLGSDVAPPGYVGTYEATPLEGFNCANCHAVHGSKAFRNLGLSRYMGLPSGSAQNGAAGNVFGTTGPKYNMLNEFVDGTAGREAAAAGDDVFVEAAARTYQTAQVQFRQGTPGANGMNAYCAVCHGNFHGDGNTRDLIGGVDFVRHPTSGVVRNVASGTPLLNFANPLTGVTQVAQIDFVRPAWVNAGETGDFEAACLSCHKGHGNANGYGLLYPSNVGAVSNFENGDAAPSATVLANENLRNLCITCHAQGRDLDDPTSK
jgi:hypothetical protein